MTDKIKVVFLTKNAKLNAFMNNFSFSFRHKHFVVNMKLKM